MNVSQFFTAANLWAQSLDHQVPQEDLEQTRAERYLDSIQKQREPQIPKHVRMFITHVLGMRNVQPAAVKVRKHELVVSNPERRGVHKPPFRRAARRMASATMR